MAVLGPAVHCSIPSPWASCPGRDVGVLGQLSFGRLADGARFGAWSVLQSGAVPGSLLLATGTCLSRHNGTMYMSAGVQHALRSALAEFAEVVPGSRGIGHKGFHGKLGSSARLLR